tara:strand:+ start:24 stop:413 length:390 start_codon:yes stop_codon:yes gene_type:complete
MTELQKTFMAYPKDEQMYMLELDKMSKVDLILWLNNLNIIRKKEDELQPKFKIGDKICYYDTLDSFTGVIRGTGEVKNDNGNINKIYLIEGTQDNSKEIEWFEFSVERVDEWGELLNTSYKKSVGPILV